MSFTRRESLVLSLTGSAVLASGALAEHRSDGPLKGERVKAEADVSWKRGLDNQRQPDLGDGRYLNPINAGDHPDPTILKDGEDYYMIFSTFDLYPGLLIWHSRDLVNWEPRRTALARNVGTVWAPDLVKHDGRYFVYFPTKSPATNWVIWADQIDGPWSDPIDLNLPAYIDPGHAVGEDGSRWLFLSGGDRVRLSDDGLMTIGVPEHVYDPWHYPEDWVVESFSPEGPKIMRRGDYYYMISAVGGTAGPPTGHMVISARSRTINGPWENCPANPLVHTRSSAEKWWSRGHASLVEGPNGDWWSVYHGYENGFWTLGRQTLLDPVEWTADGWFRMKGGDLSQPIAKPQGGKVGRHGIALSDNFSGTQLQAKWKFFRPGADEQQRVRVAAKTLYLEGRGSGPGDSAPLLLTAGDQAYQFQCDVEIPPGGVAGLILFYDARLYCGLGFDEKQFVPHQYGTERAAATNPHSPLENPHGRRMLIRLVNACHVVSFFTSGDGGKTWKRFNRGMEVSGYHHNVRGGFLSLCPGLYSSGSGVTKFRDFQFRAL